jgi:hypothetical protein
MKRKTIIALLTLFLLAWPLGQIAAAPPTGKLEVPHHHAGVLGENEIPVKATDLQIGTTYRITMRVSYRQNPRAPPESESTRPPDKEARIEFVADGDTFTHKFVAPLPDCHWQITAGFTLYYLDGKMWDWNGDEDATQGVYI